MNSHGVAMKIPTLDQLRPHTDALAAARTFKAGVEMVEIASKNVLAGDNWYKVENWGCWSSGNSARLEFATPVEEQGSLICFLAIQAPFYMVPVEFRVLINDRETTNYNLELSEIRIIKIDLPCVVMTEDFKYFAHRIELQMSKTLLPPPDSIDGRILGIGVRSLFVCHNNDVFAQLSYWQSQLLISPIERRLEARPPNSLDRRSTPDAEKVHQQNAGAAVK